MDSFNIKLKKILKKTNNYLICAILFLLFSLGCFGWAYFVTSNVKDNDESLHDLIYKGSTQENQVVSLTVTEKPYLFAEYDTDSTSDKYYFLMDENYLYVGYLDYATYLKLNNDKIEEEPITIKGITTIIPDDVIDIAIEVYNEEVGDEFLTKGNYKSYIGEICIDTVNEIGDNLFQILLGISFGIIGFIYLVIYIIKRNKINIMKKDIMLWEKIKIELESSETLDYYKFGLCLTPNFIVDGSKGLNLISYADIVWIYLHEQKYNGITCYRHLIAVTKNKKKFIIAELTGIHSKVKNTYLEIIKDIHNKNQSMLVGYTKENKKQVKNLYQVK